MPVWCIRNGFSKDGEHMRRLSVILLVLFAFAVPWEYSLELGEPLGNVARVLGILLLLVVVPAAVARRGFRRSGPILWLVMAFYLYFACTCFWTVDADSSIEKLRAYFQVMMVVWLVWEAASTAADLRMLMRAFVAGCWVLAALTWLDFASANAGDAAQLRFAASGQDPNDVARFLDMGFPFAALLFAIEESWPVRIAAILYLPAGLLAVLLTASRGGFTAALCALVGSAALLVHWRPRAASAVFLGLAATASLLWLFVPGGSLDRLATIPEQVGSGDLNERLNIWTAGWQAFTHAPWFGSGAGTFTIAADLAPGDTAHNTLMAVLVTAGLAGTAILVSILACVGRAALQCRGLLRIGLTTALLSWGVSSMVGSVEENRATWLIFAIIALAGRIQSESPDALVAFFAGSAPSHQTVPEYAKQQPTAQ
jgi:O-antigen ligase